MFGFDKLNRFVFQQIFHIRLDVVKIRVAHFLAPLFGHHRAVPQTADAFVLYKQAV